jgi:hypothetical protein
MASNQHRNLTGEQLHNPKGFDGASPSTTLIKNAAGEIEWVSNSNFDNALDYVSPQSAPPTEVEDDIYLLDDTGVVYDIDTIAWQSGNTIRYTFNGTPNLSAITAGDYLVTSGNGNSSNDGTFVISAVDDGLDYIEITNALRSDATDDEASDAVGTAYYTLEEWDGASKGSHIKFDGTNWNSINAQDGTICYDETSSSHRIYDAANTNWDTSLSTAAGGITASGTPVDNQVAVFTSATNVEGHTGFTYDSTKTEISLIQGNSGAVISYKDVKITAETDSASLQMTSHSSSHYPEIISTRTRGTLAIPAAIQSGDDLLRQNFFGHNGTTAINGANIIVEATENWSGSNRGVSYTIGTEANGGTGIVDRFKIDGSGDITLGNFKFDGTQTVGAGQDNYVLTYDNATGKISLEASAGGGGGLTDVVDDTTPQLGGSLDVNGNKIVSVSNGNIDIEPNGTGNVLLGNFTFDADQTVGAGQDNYVLTYDNATGLISLEAAAGGGSSLWTDNGNRITDSNYYITEINKGVANTFNAATYTVGNLIIGDGNTLGSVGNNMRGSLIFGETNTAGSTGSITDCAVIGRQNTLKDGDYSLMFGYLNEGSGNQSLTGGYSNTNYGNENIVLGYNHNVGTSATPADYSYVFGKDLNTSSDYQMAIGYGISKSFNTSKYIGFGLCTTGTQQPTAGFGIDPTGSVNGAINFALGGQNAFEDGIGINQAGSGNGILYFHNYNGTRTVEPSANIPHSVALWGADNASGGQTGLIIKSEDGTRHFFSKYSAIGGDETVATANKTLTVAGTGTGSGTSSLLCEDSGGTTTFEVLDNGTAKSKGQIGSSAGATPNTETPTGTTETIDWNNGNYQILDLESASGNVTLTLSNPVVGFAYFLEIRQDSTTPLDVIFPSSVKFAGETAPYTLDVSTGANAVDAVSLAWNGSEYIASFSQNHG